MNKTLVITGATRGIGRATSELFLKKGYKVIGIYKERSDLAKELESKYPKLALAPPSDFKGKAAECGPGMS